MLEFIVVGNQKAAAKTMSLGIPQISQRSRDGRGKGTWKKLLLLFFFKSYPKKADHQFKTSEFHCMAVYLFCHIDAILRSSFAASWYLENVGFSEFRIIGRCASYDCVSLHCWLASAISYSYLFPSIGYQFFNSCLFLLKLWYSSSLELDGFNYLVKV